MLRDTAMRPSTLKTIARAAVLALALALPASAAAQGDVFVVLQTDPNGSTASFSFTHTFGASTSVPSPFSLTDGTPQIFNGVPAGQYSVTIAPAAGWSLVASGDGYETGCWGNENSSLDISTGVATINLGSGEFVVCTFVMREDAAVDQPVDGSTSFTPKGLGYWKNSGKCLRSQELTDADSDGTRLLESQLLGGSLVYPLGNITGMTCLEAARILDKSDLAGGKKANDGAYNLAAHLLAAKLNKAAGAFVPPCVANDMATAQSLLVQLGFTGMGDYLGPTTSMRALRTTVLRLGGTLGQYNGGALQNGNCV